MHKEVVFVHSLAPGSIARVRFTKERGRIVEFVVQLECLIGEEWRPVVRYDTAHGFAHQDILHPNGTTEKRALPVTDFNRALTFAQLDVKTNWQRYKERYARWLK